MINRDDYRPLISSNTPLTNTSSYARIERAPANVTAWRAVLVHHLPPEINRGGHAIYIGALDLLGNWMVGHSMRVGWTWEGRRDDEPAEPKPFEKLPPEPGAVVDLFMGQNTSVWIEDDTRILSDRVHGLHSSVENLAQFNTWGHNSFVVLFQLMGPTVVTPPPTDGPDEPSAVLTLAQRVTRLEDENKRLWDSLAAVAGQVDKLTAKVAALEAGR